MILELEKVTSGPSLAKGQVSAATPSENATTSSNIDASITGGYSRSAGPSLSGTITSHC